MSPKLSKVIRLDSLPLSKASFTPEGYLKDKPVLTSVGIFEYINADGSVRRELRLPEDVFDPESLKSFKGKPIIITHEAGLVTKDNVSENSIGTILTDGYKDGDDVRAEIVIHDTDAMKDCGFKELSLGYNLDLEEESGVWNGEHYDAIQRNIRINHLALVREARAGEQARLNIDGRDQETLKGGKVMRKTPTRTSRADGILTPDELAKAIEEYKANRKMAEGNADAEAVEEEIPAVEPKEEAPVEEKIDFLKQKKIERDAEEEPAETDDIKEMLVRQDEDMQKLFDIIDTLLAEKAFDAAEKEIPDMEQPVEEPKLDAEDVEFLDEEEEKMDEDDIIPDEDCEGGLCEKKDSKKAEYDKFTETHSFDEGEEEEEIGFMQKDGCGFKKDAEALVPEEEEEEVEEEIKMNTDSVDKIIRQRIKLGMIGKSLNLDGLENVSIKRAKKAIIKAVRPSVNLDGKSNAYINAMYECALADVKARNTKNADYQKRQMFNKDSAPVVDKNSSDNARQRMIERHNKK